MTYDLLTGLRIVEAASFIAGPSCGLHCAQMGAEVIRIDPVGGGPDRRRWPKASNGVSLYWEGLNKGKKSVCIDLQKPEGRELAQRLATAQGEGGGLFITNFPVDGFLAHDKLAALRADIISLRIMGWADGTPAVDYTVNAAVGIPLMTGPESLGDEPVNSVLPAWDLIAGSYGAFALLAAERARSLTGSGQEIRLPLGTLAAATLGNLGQLAEVLLSGEDRPRYGNDLFGGFGRDFLTGDGKRVMLFAITARQWRDLINALGLESEIAVIESKLSVSFAADEGLRFEHRATLYPLFKAELAQHSLADLTARFEGTGVCWSPYRTVGEAAHANDRFGLLSGATPSVQHAGGFSYPTPNAAAEMVGHATSSPGMAHRLGADTEAVLADTLKLPASEIARLFDTGIVAS